ncbi:unnamed protein product [Soboliphyme baturini]|uniref:WASH complex subunit strumpellin n=1 Tax=Soboliphyme baturini TaxID=241478 RepID=A0A183IBC6_9BILA|nr:unnamed protein product [Soboliphyme baturini]
MTEAGVFLSDDNLCGQTLLQLVSRGNVILAEILHLSQSVPFVFTSVNGLNKFAEIIKDFTYFQIQEEFEREVEASEKLRELDVEFRELYATQLTRYFNAFLAVHQYISDLSRFADEVEEGFYVHDTMESISQDPDGKQLLAESLYLLGIMLIIVDLKFSGVVRERLLVSYHRYRRVNLKDNYINFVIGMLRSDDIYQQLLTFPLPEHRSTALADQGAILFVCLFFTPETLHSNAPVMREIVDKYFYDNWTITIHLGMTVNLFEAWEPYKAAYSALNITLQPAMAKLKAQNFHSEIQELNKEIQRDVSEDVLKDDFVLINMNKLKLKGIYSSKMPEAQRLQGEVAAKLGELIEVFSGSRPLLTVQKNDRICEDLVKLKSQLQEVCFDNLAIAGYKVLTLVKNLDELQELHGLDAQEIVRDFLSGVRSLMHMMVRVIKLNEDALIKLQLITDMSYAWEIIYGFTERMQRFVQKDPTMCVKLRAVFLKLSSGISSPLLRIQQAKSKDFGWVSHFYSKHLLGFVRHVLQIIPQTVFSLMEQIIKLQATGFKEVPTHVPKDHLRDYAQDEERFKIAKFTNSVSVLAEGMLMLKTTVLGVIEIDPKQLLEDGIRQELVNVLASQLHTSLIFSPRSKLDLLPKLQKLTSIIEAYRRSFHYISDYIGLCGLKIWQEELKRVVFFNVEQECNHLLGQEVRFAFVSGCPRVLSNVYVVSTCYCHELGIWFDSKSQKEVLTAKQAFEVLLTALGNVGVWGLDRYYSFLILLNFKEFSQMIVTSVVGNQQLTDLLNNITPIQSVPPTAFDHFCKNYLTAFGKASRHFFGIYETISKIGNLQVIRIHLMRVLNKSCKINSRLYEDMLRTLNNLDYGKGRKPDAIDSMPFAIGIMSILKQCEDRLVAAFWDYSLQFIKLYLIAESRFGFYLQCDTKLNGFEAWVSMMLI